MSKGSDYLEVRKTIQSLLHLQELELVLAESSILHQNQATPPLGLAAIQHKIQDYRSNIREDYLRRYDMLRKNGLGVVKEAAGVCTGCHLNVPVGDLNRMRHCQIPWVCPNCARFLFIS